MREGGVKDGTGWIKNGALLDAIFRNITRGESTQYVMVNSMPRTGSKYLYGVLAAAWGVRDGRTYAMGLGPPPYNLNIGHGHGLSDRRMELAGAEAKQQAIVRSRELIESASHVTCFTIFRPSRERRVSSFMLRKSQKFDMKDEAKVAAEFARFWVGEIGFETHFLESEIAGYFGVPYLEPGEVSEFAIFRKEGLDYVVLELSAVDGLLEKYLYPIVDKEELVDRSRLLELYYGLENRNTSKDRGIEASRVEIEKAGMSSIRKLSHVSS
jgi:hypothetical protein